MEELRPLVDEYSRLEAAAAALATLAEVDVTGGARGRTSARRRGPGRPSGGARSTPKRGKPQAPGKAGQPKRRSAGRQKGSGVRAAEAFKIVQEHPGVTIPELAIKMGIKQNYLYRVLPSLEKEGKVQKQGRGWHPKA
jgi:hypothetical protein